MNITKTTNFEKNIDNNFWLELVLAMTYVKNSRPIKALQNLGPYKALI